MHSGRDRLLRSGLLRSIGNTNVSLGPSLVHWDEKGLTSVHGVGMDATAVESAITASINLDIDSCMFSSFVPCISFWMWRSILPFFRRSFVGISACNLKGVLFYVFSAMIMYIGHMYSVRQGDSYIIGNWNSRSSPDQPEQGAECL